MNKTLAILLAVLVGLAAFYVADLDPWGWWSEHERATSAESAARRRFPEGPASVTQPRPEGTDSSASAEPHPLILTATQPGRNAYEGTADLGVEARSPQRYRAGARLVNGARLEEIHGDHVVLERAGVRTRLYLPGRAPADAPPPLAALATVGGIPRQSPAQAGSSDPLTDHLRLAPVFAGDAVRALEVHANARSRVFGQLGLEPGDRITAIEGAAVTDMASALARLRPLSEGAALSVTVERDGRVSTLALDGAVVVAAHQGR
ncbi:MAG: PDZ domain-containing protein [Gammaproteobacteria bacterium]|nr:PDZ domain-containing protein [Gammaproteobacteria bacterium]